MINNKQIYDKDGNLIDINADKEKLIQLRRKLHDVDVKKDSVKTKKIQSDISELKDKYAVQYRVEGFNEGNSYMKLSDYDKSKVKIVRRTRSK